jgi:hypothetical protein
VTLGDAGQLIIRRISVTVLARRIEVMRLNWIVSLLSCRRSHLAIMVVFRALIASPKLQSAQGALVGERIDGDGFRLCGTAASRPSKPAVRAGTRKSHCLTIIASSVSSV